MMFIYISLFLSLSLSIYIYLYIEIFPCNNLIWGVEVSAENLKLIPKMITNILSNKPLPIYARGLNSREWIFVDDHCEALYQIFKKGKIGESYNVGSNINLKNLNLVKNLLKIFKKKGFKFGKKVKIKFVKDRPGHDFRYSLNSTKIRKKLKLHLH